MVKKFLTESLPSRVVRDGSGAEFLWFSGTDYLGMGYHPAFTAYLSEGVMRYGTHFGSSRNNSLQLRVYGEAESRLALFTGAPAALSVSSGMWAGQFVRTRLPLLAGEASCTHHYEAPGLHPALRNEPQRGAQVTHAEWLVKTVEEINAAPAGHLHFIYSDAVGCPWTEQYDFSPLTQIQNRHTWLVVDDSHGLGVLGEQGAGSFAELARMDTVNLLAVASLNKALGIPGGIILGSAEVLEALRRSPWFGAGSPVPPAYMYAMERLLACGDYEAAYRRLMQNNEAFTSRVDVMNHFAGVPGYPGYSTRDTGLHDFLMRRGILTSCFSYPGPGDAPVVRLVITAAHLSGDIEKLAAACNSYPA